MNDSAKNIKLAGAAAAALYLSNKKNRDKLKREFTQAMENPEQFVSDMIDGVEKVRRILTTVYMELWGSPSDDEDGKMVAEGALTSVQYYNRHQEKSPDSAA